MPSTISSTRAADRLGELAGGGGAAQLLGQLGGRRADLHAQLLQAARHPDRPALVAEVALDLADDRRGRVGRELHAAVGVEAVDRLDQADRADLDEVLERLTAVAEAPRAVLDQRQVQVHEVVAGGGPRRRGASSASRIASNSSALRRRVTSMRVARRPVVRVPPLPVVPRDVVAHLRARHPPCRRPADRTGCSRKRTRRPRRRSSPWPRWPACPAPARRSCRGPGAGRRSRRSRPDTTRVAGAEVEATGQVGARVGLREHQRAGLADGDPQVLDVVDGEVEPGGQAGRRGPEHRRRRRRRRAAGARRRPAPSGAVVTGHVRGGPSWVECCGVRTR